MKRLLMIFPLLLFLLLFIYSPNDDSKYFTTELTAKIDSLLTEIMTAKNLPSIAVSIEVKGEIYNYCEGYSNLEKSTKRHLESPIRIASITKTFTATLILMLADEGKLDTDDYLVEYLPDFPNAANITIKNLLMMRSGITDYANTEFMKIIYDQPFLEFTQDSLIARSAAMAEHFTDPDLKTIYCNVNYIILGKIVEIVTGNDLHTACYNRIFKPFSLKHTFYPQQGDFLLPGSLRGYCWEEDRFIDYTELNPLWSGAAGAMISNIPDLRTFARLIYYGFNHNPQIQQERLQTITFKDAPNWFEYGEGLTKLGEFYGHSGIIFGFWTEMWYQPENDAAIVISVNRSVLEEYSQPEQIFLQLSRLIFPQYVNW